MANDLQRHLLPGGRELDAVIGCVRGKAQIGQAPQHFADGSRADLNALRNVLRCNLARFQMRFVDGLDIIFDGRRRHALALCSDT